MKPLSFSPFLTPHRFAHISPPTVPTLSKSSRLLLLLKTKSVALPTYLRTPTAKLRPRQHGGYSAEPYSPCHYY
jgi:hypothetical protein